MIEYDPKNLPSILFRVRGSVIVRILPRIVIATVLGAVAHVVHRASGAHFPTIPSCSFCIPAPLRSSFSFWEGPWFLTDAGGPGRALGAH